jgi:hypothetical protein
MIGLQTFAQKGMRFNWSVSHLKTSGHGMTLLFSVDGFVIQWSTTGVDAHFWIYDSECKHNDSLLHHLILQRPDRVNKNRQPCPAHVADKLLSL